MSESKKKKFQKRRRNLNTAKPIGVPIIYPIMPARLPEKIKSFLLKVELMDAAVAEPPTQALLKVDEM